MSHIDDALVGDDLNIPNDDAIRAEVLAIPRDIYSLPTGDKSRAQAKVDPKTLSETARERLLEAKLTLGPGAHADAVDVAMHEQFVLARDAEKRLLKLEDEYSRVEYDPQTRRQTYAFTEDQREAMVAEAEQLRSQIELIKGPGGQMKLRRAVDKAVADRREQYKRDAITAAAEKLAARMKDNKAVLKRAKLLLAREGFDIDD